MRVTRHCWVMGHGGGRWFMVRVSERVNQWVKVQWGGRANARAVPMSEQPAKRADQQLVEMESGDMT